MRTLVYPMVLIIAIAFFCGCVEKREDTAEEEPQMSNIDLLLEKADSMFGSRSYEGSRGAYMEAAKEAETEGNNSILTEAYSQIARTYLILNQKEDGREWIVKAEAIADTSEPLGWSRYLGVRGRFEWQDKNPEKATATFKEMYGYASERKLYERAIDAAHMVAITGTPEQQVEWGLKGINEAVAGNVTGWLGPLWNNLGATYEDMGRYQECLQAYMKAREYHHQYGDEMNKYVADWAVGHAHRLAGNLDDAEAWLTKTLEWCERAESNEFIGWCHKDLGEVALARHDKQVALDHFVIAEEKLKAEGMPEWDPDGYNKLTDQIEELKK